MKLFSDPSAQIGNCSLVAITDTIMKYLADDDTILQVYNQALYKNPTITVYTSEDGSSTKNISLVQEYIDILDNSGQINPDNDITNIAALYIYYEYVLPIARNTDIDLFTQLLFGQSEAFEPNNGTFPTYIDDILSNCLAQLNMQGYVKNVIRDDKNNDLEKKLSRYYSSFQFMLGIRKIRYEYKKVLSIQYLFDNIS